MKSARSSNVISEEILILDSLSLDAPRTKDMVAILKNNNANKKVLIVTAEKNENVIRSANNIPGVETTLVSTLNVYDILKHDLFIITQEAVKKVEEVYA